MALPDPNSDEQSSNSLFPTTAEFVRICEALAKGQGAKVQRTLTFALRALADLLPFRIHSVGWKEKSGVSAPRASVTNSKRACSLLITGPDSAVRFQISADKAYFQAPGDPSRGYLMILMKAFAKAASQFVEFTAVSKLTNGLPQAILRTFSDVVVGTFLARLESSRARFSTILRVLQESGSETYENRSVCQGILISSTPAKQPGSPAVSYLWCYEHERKRLFPLSDGHHTALVLDRDGNLCELRLLRDAKKADANLKRSRGRHRYYPEWIQGLACETATGGGVGLVLTRLGEILVVYQGFLLLSYRKSKWSVFVHTANVNEIRERIESLTVGRKVANRLADSIYSLALDLAYRRTGALLAIVDSHADMSSFLSRSDRFDSAPLRGIRSIFREYALGHSVDRRFWHEVCSLDGATVFDTKGRLVACGAIVKQGDRGLADDPGARTRAARTLSHAGIAIKVSSDGEIVCFKCGKKFLEIR